MANPTTNGSSPPIADIRRPEHRSLFYGKGQSDATRISEKLRAMYSAAC